MKDATVGYIVVGPQGAMVLGASGGDVPDGGVLVYGSARVCMLFPSRSAASAAIARTTTYAKAYHPAWLTDRLVIQRVVSAP